MGEEESGDEANGKTDAASDQSITLQQKAALLATFVSRTNLDVKMWADSLKLVARITAGLRGEAGTPRRFTPHGLILSMNPLAYASDSGIDVGSPNPLEFLFMSPVKGM